MAKKLTAHWTEKALDSLEDILSDIIKKWNIQAAHKFDEDVDKLIAQLEKKLETLPSF